MSDEMKMGDYSRVQSDAIAQVEAGAHMLDVNAGIPLADEPRIHLVQHLKNRGKGAAIRTALETAEGDYCLIQDADLEYEVSDYPALLREVASCVEV